MANFLLSWNSSFYSGDQIVQYRLSGVGSYTDAATVSEQTDTYTITGLLADTLYDFRVKADCGVLYTDVIVAINISCPTLTITTLLEEIQYEFNDSLADLDKYIIELWKENVLVSQNTLLAPFSNPLNGSFTGLEENGIYQIRLKAYSGDYEKICDFSTATVPLCVNVIDIQGDVDESGTITISLIKLDFDQQAHIPQTIQLSYRLSTDADLDINYNSLPDATVDVNGIITSPSPYEITIPETSIVIRATNDCGTANFQKTYVICEPVELTASITGQCATGYVLSPDGTYCYQEDVQDADCSGGVGTNTACHFTAVEYGQFGTIFYKQGGYNTNGTYTIAPARLDTVLSGLGVYAGTIWGNPVPNTADGRLNKTGIWLCGNQSYNALPLGFTKQIIVSTSKYYYIGVGADNTATLIVNGTTIVSQNETALNTQNGVVSSSTFKWWHVYPVFLNAGVNYLELTGTNASSIGVFGVEIYDATEAQLLAITTEPDLDDVIIYSSKDVIDGDAFDAGNCNCDALPGYSLIYDIDSSSFKCKKILTQTPT